MYIGLVTSSSERTPIVSLPQPQLYFDILISKVAGQKLFIIYSKPVLFIWNRRAAGSREGVEDQEKAIRGREKSERLKGICSSYGPPNDLPVDVSEAHQVGPSPPMFCICPVLTKTERERCAMKLREVFCVEWCLVVANWSNPNVHFSFLDRKSDDNRIRVVRCCISRVR